MKVSPTKGVVQFDKKRKLTPRYIGHKIVRKVHKVAYELKLSMEMNMIYSVFHVSILRKFMEDPNSLVSLEDLSIEENLVYEEILVQILDWQVKRLRNKERGCIS